MQKRSEADIVAAIQSGELFECETEDGALSIKIEAYVPSICTALHAGHQFRASLQRYCCLTEAERLYEEDPLTEQLIAANINTLFVVSALNHNFSLNRIERYLVLAREAGAEVVVVLTKADLCDDPAHCTDQVRALDPMLMVEAVNARDQASVQVLEPWCRTGHTVAMLGSSGVGKSTLINTLLGQVSQDTAPARASDDKGRHTTTSRSLHWMANGSVLLDTPGMRELQLTDCESGVQETFADIEALVAQCRYSDCQHQTEPGCAVLAALDTAQIDQRRLSNYLKLMREQAHNSASLAEKRARDRSLSRFYRSVQNESRSRKKGR